MSQIPPPGAYAPQTQAPYQPTPARSNPLAIVSLICGIVGCLVITPIVGIITGLLALPKSRLQGGKGMAIAGIILSLLWIVGGGVAGYAGYQGYQVLAQKVLQPAETAMTTYVNGLVDNDIATAKSVTTGINAQDIAEHKEKLAKLGKMQSFSMTGVSADSNTDTVHLTGIGTFEKGTASLTVDIATSENGVKIESLTIK